ncbi:MAG TPA: ABC transporter substrate-binding protein [Devosiaceae bacterium]
MKKLLLTTSAAVLALSLGMGAPAWAQNAKDTIVIGTDVDAGTLDPRLTTDTTAYRTADLVYAGLVHITPSLTAVPDLAESWENPDPTTWVFHLRKGLKFSDGSPLTAADVVYTFTTITDPKFNAPQRALFAPIKAVEAVDDNTVKFTLSAPYAPLLSYLDMGIVSKAAVEGGAKIAQEPLGAGPMKLTAWNHGSDLQLEPNPNYWGGAPKVNHVTLKIIGDNSARAQAFEAGDLDVIQAPLSPGDIKRLQADSRFGNVVIPGLGVTYINYNTKDPLLADAKMRDAFSMLIDSNTIVNDIYQGVDVAANSVILPSSWAYSADIKQPPFDVDGAVKLFNEEGWKDTNGDGILDKDGKPLTVTLATHSEDPNRVQAIEFIQATMQAAGVDAKAQITDWPSFSTNYVQKSMHQIALLGWLNIVDPDRLLFSQLTTGGPTNWGGYSNPEVDKLLQEGRSALTQDERKTAYQGAAKILAADVPYYIVSDQGYQLFYSKDLPYEVQVTPRGNLRGLIGYHDDK